MLIKGVVWFLLIRGVVIGCGLCSLGVGPVACAHWECGLLVGWSVLIGVVCTH